VWAPNRIWGWDLTQFTRARRCAFAIIDIASRKWIDTLVSVEETSTQVKVIFERVLLAEGLVDLITPERLELPADDPARPILLAVSDNAPPDEERRDGGVHGRHGCRPAPRTAPHPDRPGLDRAAVRSREG